MGYSAYIRCNCFEKGLAKPFKYAQYLVNNPDCFDLNLPEELKGTSKESEIEDEFSSWRHSYCEHEDGEYYSDCICNILGMAHFRSTIDSLNGEKKFPTLYNYLPTSNDGYIPFKENENFKNELLKLKSYGKIHSLGLYYKDEEGYLNLSANAVNGNTEIFFFHPKADMGLNGHKFFISTNNEIVFESRDFSVKKNAEGYVFKDNENQNMFVSDAFFLEESFKKMDKIVFSMKEEDIDIEEAHGYIIDTLLTLIEKSNEIGMPVCWI